MREAGVIERDGDGEVEAGGARVKVPMAMSPRTLHARLHAQCHKATL